MGKLSRPGLGFTLGSGGPGKKTSTKKSAADAGPGKTKEDLARYEEAQAAAAAADSAARGKKDPADATGKTAADQARYAAAQEAAAAEEAGMTKEEQATAAGGGPSAPQQEAAPTEGFMDQVPTWLLWVAGGGIVWWLTKGKK